MDELIYGVWKGRAYDNRRTIDGKAPEGLPAITLRALPVPRAS